MTKERPGRPATIHVDQIVDAAIDVIDDGGLDSCTMRAVAHRLGVSPMSLYRHIADKDALLDLIPDVLLADLAAKVARRRSGRMVLREIADGMFAVLAERPWAARLFEHPAPGPNMERAAKHCIERLVDEGVAPDEAFRWIRAVVAQVIGEALTSHDGFDPTGVELLLASIGTRTGSSTR